MTQTAAILLDAYRELNSRKLFWVTLILSGLVVVAFGMVGISDKGLRVVVWDLPIPGLNTSVISEETFYKTLFASLGVKFWLAWSATILALASTAGVFPDLISSGSIDLVLARPIGRVRLFLTKYAGGLLFAGLQVAVFSAASFLVLGLRGGTWEPAVFLAIPLVVLFFSYLFSVCALLGLLTRSSVAALLLTLLVWFLIFAVHGAESGVMSARLMDRQQLEYLEAGIAASQETLAGLEAQGDEISAQRARTLRESIETRRGELEEERRGYRRISMIHRTTLAIKTLLPKTTETIGLVERWLIAAADLPQPPEVPRPPGGAFSPDLQRLQQEAMEEIRGRSVMWILGTSAGFEALVLGIGAFIFKRRDF